MAGALTFPVFCYQAILKQPHENGLYAKGEKIQFEFKIIPESGDDPENAVLEYSFSRRYGLGGGWQKASFGETYHLETVLENAGGVFVELRILDAKTKKTLLDRRKLPIQFQIGAVVAPEELKTSSPEPEDFDAFWSEEVKNMRKTPLRILEKKSVPGGKGTHCYDVKVSFPGGNPVSGYVAMPSGASPKSLPLWISYHGAGVYPARKYQNCGNVIRADFNAHGLPNDMPQEYYSRLRAGKYKNYLLRNMGDRDRYFMKSIFLRALRALDYMKTFPEWDGKNIIVSGHSQGGAQAIFVSGLDSTVTLLEAEAPGWCDMLGPMNGRRGGGASWGLISAKRNPAYAKAMAYYDMVHFARRIRKADVYLTAGFGDSVCPATSIYCAYNALPKHLKRHLQVMPEGGHSSRTIHNSESRKAIQNIISSAKCLTFSANESYRPVQIDHQLIQAGSALDLGEWNHLPAGKFGRVVIGKNGYLEFAERPGRPIRFRGCNNPLSRDEFVARSGDFETYKNIVRRDVAAVRRAGYNLYRINALPNALDTNSFTGLCEISEDGLRRLDFLLAELKKNGIYVQIAMLGPTYFEPISMRAKTFAARNMHKLLFYAGRSDEREQFRFAVSLLNHVNSYTGVAWKDEPAIAFIEYYNELYAGLALASQIRREYPRDFEEFRAVYDRWLGRRSSENDLKKGNPNYVGFCEYLVKECLAWCEEQVSAVGYQGITLQNNYRSLFYASASWPKMKMLDNHTYFQHPRKGCMIVGSEVPSESSIALGINYLRDLMGGRFPDRPFGIGEFYHVFWNPYQYEMGAVAGAYGALQDFSVMSIHAEVIVSENPWRCGVLSFSVGHNPVARACEFLSAHLFRRRYVNSSKNWTVTEYPEILLKHREILADAPAAEQSFAGLVCKYGIVLPGKTDIPLPKAAVRLKPRPGSSVIGNDWFSEVVDRENNTDFLVSLEKKLRTAGILDSANRSSFPAGVFESDTGQILLNIPEKSIRISSPCAEVLAAPASVRGSFQTMQEIQRSVDSCAALLSRDGKPLTQSEKMVLIFATRAVNSGMKLTPDNVTMIDRGKLPVLVRTGQLRCRLRGKAGYQCFALDLSGRRIAEIPLQIYGQDALMMIDTAQINPEPALFFELIKSMDKKMK